MRNKSLPVPQEEEQFAAPGADTDAGIIIRTLHRAAVDCVSKNDKAGIARIVRAYGFFGSSKDSAVSFRNKKNRFIGLCALVCEKASVQGVGERLIGSLWERYAGLCEECRTIENLNVLTLKMLFDFADKIKEAADTGLSVSVAGVKEYISLHLNERISVAEAARSVGMNASYLNSSFKEQTGLCITDYIQQQKTEEAKKLLADPEKPISEIWTALGYYDQSHFNKSFKKCAGLTPKQYRAKEQSRLTESKGLDIESF